MRHTDEYLKSESAREIRLWSARAADKKEKEKTTSTHVCLKPTTPGDGENDVKLVKSDEFAKQLENELREAESEWANKCNKLANATAEAAAAVHKDAPKFGSTSSIATLGGADDSQYREKLAALQKKFLNSMDIHKKPSDFHLLRNVFTFKHADTLSPSSTSKNADENSDPGHALLLLLLNQDTFKPLMFVEYIAERVQSLMSEKSQLYLAEANVRDELAKEREREEYMAKCDRVLTEKLVEMSTVTSQLDFDDTNKGATKRFVRSSLLAKRSEDDNGEAELQAIFDDFAASTAQEKSNVICTVADEKKSNGGDVDGETVIDLCAAEEAKKPLPDYKRLRAEAIQQQLRIKEFFRGAAALPKPTASCGEQQQAIDEEEESSSSAGQFKQSLIMHIKETNEEIVRMLPTVDSKSQLQIRRQIFFERLVK